METISLLLTLTLCQGLRNCLFTIKILSKNSSYVNKMCDKFGGQKIHPKKDIQNLPTRVAERNHFTIANFDTPKD